MVRNPHMQKLMYYYEILKCTRAAGQLVGESYDPFAGARAPLADHALNSNRSRNDLQTPRPVFDATSQPSAMVTR